MAIHDILLPFENVVFRTKDKLRYSQKNYNVLITNGRLILYAQRGKLLKTPDMVSESLDSIHGVEYREKGIIFKMSKITLQCATKLEIIGPSTEVKPLFEFIQSTINNPIGKKENFKNNIIEN